MGLLIFSRWKDNISCCIIYSKTLSSLKNGNDINKTDVCESIILWNDRINYFTESGRTNKQTFISKKQFL
jgi:hypothetical protein